MIYPRSGVKFGFRLFLGAAVIATGCSLDGAMPGGTGNTSGSDTGGSSNPGTGGSGSGGSSTGSGGSTTAGSGGSANAGSGGADTGSGGSVGTGSGGAGNGSGGSGNVGTGGSAGAPGSGGAGVGTGGTAMGSGGSSGSGGAAGSTVADVPLDSSLLSKCTGSNPIRCTIPVPNDGDYNVTVEVGSATVASTSRIQAELYRIEVQPVTLAAGAYAKYTFSVNVRMEKHDGYMAPSKILDLLIDGSAPALHGVGFAAAPSIPTIFVAGDSTVCDWDPALASINDPNQRGWAQEFSQYMKPGMAMANYADSGETAGSFYTKFFPQARDAMRAGDYLFVQFGHNDQKAQADIDAYKSNLMKYITDAKAKGATPVIFTPLARKGATTADPGFAGLDQQARDLATSQNVALVDLTTLAIAYYKTVTNLASLFGQGDSTHPSEAGATQISGVVANNLKMGTLPLKTLLK